MKRTLYQGTVGLENTMERTWRLDTKKKGAESSNVGRRVSEKIGDSKGPVLKRPAGDKVRSLVGSSPLKTLHDSEWMVVLTLKWKKQGLENRMSCLYSGAGTKIRSSDFIICLPFCFYFSALNSIFLCNILL